jgi:nitrite reductase/ring-hydroxylating ferredoxin subunit
MRRHAICRLDELPPGGMKLVEIGSIPVGVYNVDGALYAVRNQCPHRGAPLCKGSLAGTMLPSAPGDYQYGMDSFVLKCPWHRWGFDIRTGQSVLDPEHVRVRTFPVHVENGMVEIEL